jgi:hypothetical protein|tara:strand:+ start:228 stop:446 length:219 start_codon:yes stop_codon:yes gene_type:complete
MASTFPGDLLVVLIGNMLAEEALPTCQTLLNTFLKHVMMTPLAQQIPPGRAGAEAGYQKKIIMGTCFASIFI